MSGPEGDKAKPPVEIEMPKVNMNSIRERQERYRQSGRKFTLNYYGLADYFLDESVEPDIGENGHDAVTMWLDGQVSPHGATDVNGYGLTSLLAESFAFRAMKDSYTKRSAKRILKTLNNLSIKISGQDVDSHTGTPDVDKYDKILVSAIAKDRFREEVELSQDNKKDDKKERPFIPKDAELNLQETMTLMAYEKKVEKIEHDCGPCGEYGEVLEARVIGRIKILADETLLTSGLLDKNNPEHQTIIDRVENRLASAKRIEARSMMRMTAAEELLKESIDQGRGGEWIKFIKATSGAASIFNGNKQWMENQSDLEPIARQWEMLGRMVEMHPSNWIETVKRWPSFEEGFKGLSAICSGKYALGSNGEIYPTGAYGLGYVVTKDGQFVREVREDSNGVKETIYYKTGEVIDVDDAYKPGTTDRKKSDLIDGVIRLEQNQIWIPGRGAVDITFMTNIREGGVNKKVELRLEGSEEEKHWVRSDTGSVVSKEYEYFFKGWNTIINGTDGKPIEIFSKNILYWEGINDKNVDIFMQGIKKYITGVEIAQGKEPWDVEVDLGAALARNFFEMSMLGSWYGVPRDSKGKPYYGLYDLKEYKLGKGTAPRREITNMWKISTNPESEAVRKGIVANGWDEGSLFPYTVNDWGKLTLTRLKQMTEIWKGRKHGMYPLMPYLPESLAQPMFEDKVMQGIMVGDEEYKLEKVFDKMKSIGRLKTFWLDIAKGISVYEFVSSTFIGDKDPTKANEDLIAFMLQPKNFESLSKSIDLSLIYVDPVEAARLRVNIVTSALTSVAREFFAREFVGVSPTGNTTYKLSEYLEKINIRDLKENGDTKPIIEALRQLIVSRFIGGADDVEKVLKRIITVADDKNMDEVCFTRQEFLDTFSKDDKTGEEFIQRIWKLREDRRNKTGKVKNKK